ncbi:diacylglycerol/lipid kinase family protein, partial [Clostridioides difficile]|uniref:diacylglycerol/lipid kinase family protein n=1 Tax=Clostridioides difficile TaxID=1496 RepID=UPI0034DD8605
MEAAAAQPGIEAVVVAGGDGSMACAAAVMAGRDTPLGLLPLGTMNLLAKDLGLPIDLDEA